MRYQRECENTVGVARLIRTSVPDGAVDRLESNQREERRPRNICAGYGIDQQIDDRPLDRVGDNRRLDQIADRASRQVDRQAAQLRIDRCLDVLLAIGKCHAERTQRV